VTTKSDILRAIRLKCLDCCCGYVKEVRNCTVSNDCSLYLYRFGTDPAPARKGRFQKSDSTQSNFSSKQGEQVLNHLQHPPLNTTSSSVEVLKNNKNSSKQDVLTAHSTKGDEK